METKEIEHYFANSTVLQENGEETEELIDLVGYQVTNTSCSYRVPGVILPQQKICIYHLDQAERIRPM